MLDPFFTKKQPFLNFMEFYFIYVSILPTVIGLQHYARFSQIRSVIDQATIKNSTVVLILVKGMYHPKYCLLKNPIDILHGLTARQHLQG